MRYFATLGPNCSDLEVIKGMDELGLAGFRLNLSHSNLDDRLSWIEKVKEVNDNFEIILDIKGSEVRIRVKADFEVKVGDKTVLRPLEGKDLETGVIFIEDKVFRQLEIKDEIIIDDSNGRFKVMAFEEGGQGLVLEALLDAQIKDKKSMACSNKAFEFSGYCLDDINNMKKAGELGIYAFMLPFVRSGGDVLDLRRELEAYGLAKTKIYAKIEDDLGIDNIDDIIDTCDVVVIARGDLGNNIGLKNVGRAQKKIAKACRAKKKDFMVVTQLLDSMVQRPVPTRAEVNDIYNSVLDGATYLMLTQETAVGAYPVQAVRYMMDIAQIGEEDV